ncbi:nuclear transport factor 2 family protein [Rhodococcus sp. MS16]|uniref:nuclear transport factor 2 family protein n=1 Tax=Rhodococcus sp. MS16 TaxID=2579941 RepID=UPI0015629DE5|nr:nuclear transport factor 2 family protein [Rhodococcus sp. MS16]
MTNVTDEKQSIAKLTALVDEIASRQQINDLLVHYTHGCDRADVELLRSVYHPDAIDNHGKFNGPAADFAAWATDLHLGFSCTTHYICNSVVEIDGDLAHGETYVQVWIRSNGEQGVDRVIGGRYLDRFERRGGVWKIAKRHLLVDWHTLINVESLPPKEGTDTWYSGSRDRNDPSYALLRRWPNPPNVPAIDSDSQ